MPSIDESTNARWAEARRWLLLAAAASSGAVVLEACGGSTAPASATASGATSVEAAARGEARTEQSTARGLDFPGSEGVRKTMRFRFLEPLSLYPATYIWQALPRQQAGYYTAFFWGNDDGKGDLRTFLWDKGGRAADSYYGAHPYPDKPPRGNTHSWEISIEQHDFVNGAVEYDRWHTQALRVWADPSGRKHHEFYWDLPRTYLTRMVRRISPADWGNKQPPAPALTFGDAPWAPGKEVWHGVLRGFQIYSAALSVVEILAEIDKPLSTRAGARSVWYLNVDPTPSDIMDKSGRGNHPEWVGSERPTLWKG